MFSTQEAVTFLQNKWGVERVQERLQDAGQRKSLLEEIVKRIQAKVIFQSATLMSVPLEERKLPDVTAIKEGCMAGVGGVCYNVNVFSWALLQAVGFTARLCHADVLYPNDHVLVLIHDLEKEGDLHLVECGCSTPTFEAISLDFSQESPVFVHSFLEFKYIRHDGKIVRMHGDGDTIKHNDPPVEGKDLIIGKWRKLYSFVPVPSNDLADFKDDFDKVFTIPTITPFHHVVMAVAYPNEHAVMMVGNLLMVEKDGKMESTVLEGDEAIVDSYRRYFPALSEDVVRRALKEWHRMKASDQNPNILGN